MKASFRKRVQQWVRASGTRALCCLVGSGFLVLGMVSQAETLPLASAELFKTTKVWTLHLHFTLEQWQAMEPVQTGGMFGRGGPRFGPGPFGPAASLTTGFLKGDQNHDGKLSKDEFSALGEKWFGDWDKSKQGQLDLDQVREGLNATLTPQFGGGERNGGGPPGPPLQGAKGHRNGLSSAAGIEFTYVHADLEFEGQLLRDVAVRYKGNGTFMESRGSLKRSLKIDLNKYVKGQKIADETKLNLHNNVTDASWMNEVLSYRLFRDAGVPAPRTAYAKVYVTVPGQFDKKYFGLYSIVEDVDSHFAQDRFASKEGALFKPVTPELFSYLGPDWSEYSQSYDPKTDPSDSEERRVMDFAKLVSSAPDSEFAARLAEFLDLEEFARFMSVTVWLSTMDSILMMGQNFYVHLHPKTHQFQFIPWDLDHSFGQFPMAGSQQDRENLSIQKPWRGENRFLERIFNNAAFNKLYLATLKEFSKTIFVSEHFRAQVDEVAAAIRPAVAEESDTKLERFDTVVKGEPVERMGFGGGGFGRTAKPIKGFVAAREKSVNEQLAGKSEGSIMPEGGFGGPRFRRFAGGPGGPRPGVFMSREMMEAFDTNRDGKLTREEFKAGFAKWFMDWNTDKSGSLTEDQIRAGINRDLAPRRGGPPGGPDFGPPPGSPPDE